MSSPPIQYSGPVVSPEVPWETRRHLQLIYQKLGNHTQAMSLLQQNINNVKAGATTTDVIEGGSAGGGGGGSTTAGIAVNNQSGETSYVTAQGDNLALLIFSDSSAVAVSLTSQDPPWGCFATNLGASTVTFTCTPATGTINGGATFALAPNYTTILAFDGTNWWAAEFPVVPENTPAIAHEWLASYDSTTGVFTQTQPAFSDISGTATAAQVPALSALTGAITASQLPADVPVVSFGAGAPTSVSTEGYLYFDVSATPYNGYVYHSSAWHQFS